MHDTAREIGSRFFEVYWGDHFRKILDVGSRDVNGTLREFCPPAAEYVGVDLEPGASVDIVLESPASFPFENDTFDIAVSTSCFEHDQAFWLTFAEMCRVLKVGGFIYINAPSNGKYHSYPYDNWRFYPDAGLALEAWAKRCGYRLSLIESFVARRESDIWNDFVGVFCKHGSAIPEPVRFLADHFPDSFNIRRIDKGTLNLSEQPEDRLLLEHREREAKELATKLETQETQAAQREQEARELANKLKAQETQAAQCEQETRELATKLKAQETQAAQREQEASARVAKLYTQRGELKAKLAPHNRRIKSLKAQLAAIHASHSWRITAPLRAVSSGVRWFFRNARRGLTLIGWLGTGQFSRAAKAAIPYCRRYVPDRFHARIPWRLRQVMAQRPTSREGTNPKEPDATHDALMRRYIEQILATSSGLNETGVDYVAKREEAADFSHGPVQLIAFYLPQFHPIPGNDRWWGKGFTEWTNVTKARPQFLDHYQPHLPGELGFYDLRLVEVMRQQVNLARLYGIGGFCFHYYWFNGRRLLEQPIDQFLAAKDIDFPFCFCWANENWTRRWDGMDDEILIRQDHNPETDVAFINDVIPAMVDPRYIHFRGRPVLIVYRVSLLPNAAATAARWRERCKEAGVGDPYLVAARSFDVSDPRPFGFDAAVEFPPNRFPARTLNEEFRIVNPSYKGRIHTYESLQKWYLERSWPEFPLIKSVCPGWDNEARRPAASRVFHGSTPALYEDWLRTVCKATIGRMAVATDQPPFIFINAWNEWAEGAHLEPDRKYGYAYLQATRNVLENLQAAIKRGSGNRIVIVSHDAFATAPNFFLSIWQSLALRSSASKWT